MKKILFGFYIIIFTINTVFADGVTQEWAKRYDGTGNDFDGSNAICADAAGNVYLTGWSKGVSSDYDYCTIKYNSSGTQLWVSRYNGPGNAMDYPVSIKTDGSGNVYVTGYSYSGIISESSDICTIKYNGTNGSAQWVRRHNGPAGSSDQASDMVLDASGNIYVCGYSVVSGIYADYCTIKYSPSGVVLWVSYFNGPGNETDIAKSVALDNSANAYVTGWSRRQSGTGSDMFTVKYNFLGQQQWAVRYSGTGYGFDTTSVGTSIVTDDTGNVFAAGVTVNNPSYSDIVVLKYSTLGQLKWVKLYDGPAHGVDAGRTVKLDRSGNIFAAGEHTNIGTTEDFCTIKYNPAGTFQWMNSYNGSANSYDEISGMVLDRYGNVYVTGRSYGDTSNTDYCTIKYDNYGNQKWLIRYYGTGVNSMDDPMAIEIDTSGNIYVTGWSRGDFLTVKYSQLIGIQPISSEIPNQFSLYQNYPNPFNPSTKIKFDIPPSKGARGMITRLAIYDILGREIAVLVNERLSLGTYEVEWNGNNYPSGVYFCKLTAGEYSATIKLILLK